MENAKHGLCFSSGMGASDAVIKLLRPGDEVIATQDIYGGSYRMFVKIFEPFGIKFHFIDMSNAADIKKKVNEKTKMLWVESPTNPMMNIIDIAACAAIAKEKNLLLVVDNTFASPYLQNPLDLGAHIVLHSVTKYLGGHSDVVMGALCTNDDKLHEQLAFIANSCGAVPGPTGQLSCIARHQNITRAHGPSLQQCKAVAEYLRANAKVDKVFYPGFADSPNHAIAKKQMRDFGGMISFTLKGNSLEQAFKLASSMKVFSLAESLGGVESLIGHPATMTHASIPKEEREKSGVVDSLLRLSVGIEDIEDLIADLKQAIG